MKERITRMIREYVRGYEKRADISTRWGIPLVGFADACDPYLFNLKAAVASTHKLPADVLASARSIIAYFVPFTKELALTNRVSGETASPEWARAYEETNAMFRVMNEYLIAELRGMGYEAATAPEASTYDPVRLISDWSHRHFAKAAGLGTFGINNMLITESGCCGRYGTIVTNLDVTPDPVPEQERCIYKRNGKCGACIARCPSGALSPEGFDREKCYIVLRKNAERYTEFGSSYFNESGEAPNSSGSEVCGKCASNVPCSFFDLEK